MIKRLRMKMIAIMMGVLILVFAIVFLTLNLFMQASSTRQTDHLLQTVAAQDGLLLPQGELAPRPEQLPPARMPDPEMMRAGRFFYVKLDMDGRALETNAEGMFDFTEEQALRFAQQAAAGKKERGTIENLQYLAAEKPYGKIIVFAERSIQARMLSELIQISLWVACGTFAILFVFSLFLSNWAAKPVAAAFDRQRRFISDASHELKTPLTIISANVDVLENEIGENTRITHIREQSNRMNALIHDLLVLARADERGAELVAGAFDLSKTVKNTTLEFESTAFEAGRRLEYDIEEDIFYTGNEPQIKQLVSILIDNAIKHAEAGGEIKVSLQRSGEKNQLSVYNTGPGIAEEEKRKIFERFYRSDASRSRETGGYGLGLSIAKTIVDAHKGKIAVAGEAGSWVAFVVTL